jgi:streptogramin lyase
MTFQRWIYLLLLPLWFQSTRNMSPADKAKLDAQNTELHTILQNSHKLPYEATRLRLQAPNQDALSGMVSWVASDKKGLIYIIQRGDKVDPVVVMDRDGKLLHSWGKGMYTMPHAIRIDPQGNVWTTDAASSMVYKFSPEGKKLMQIEVGGQPSPCPGNFCSVSDIAFAPNGNLFIADGYKNARILEYTPDGKKLTEWGSAGTGPGQFVLPHSIQIDDKGVIYVADRENGRIQRFDLHGKYLGEWDKYGKTFGMKLDKDAIWLSSTPRGPNGVPGWLIKVDRRNGDILGYVESTGNHGMDILPDGEMISTSPGGDELPELYRLKP